MVSIAIREENSDSTADGVNCYGIDLPNTLLSPNYTTMTERGRGAPSPLLRQYISYRVHWEKWQLLQNPSKKIFFFLPGSN